MGESKVNNGVNVQALLDARKALTDAPEAAKFNWRASCKWLSGTHSKSTIQGFHGLGEELSQGRALRAAVPMERWPRHRNLHPSNASGGRAHSGLTTPASSDVSQLRPRTFCTAASQNFLEFSCCSCNTSKSRSRSYTPHRAPRSGFIGSRLAVMRTRTCEQSGPVHSRIRRPSGSLQLGLPT